MCDQNLPWRKASVYLRFVSTASVTARSGQNLQLVGIGKGRKTGRRAEDEQRREEQAEAQRQSSILARTHYASRTRRIVLASASEQAGKEQTLRAWDRVCVHRTCHRASKCVVEICNYSLHYLRPAKKPCTNRSRQLQASESEQTGGAREIQTVRQRDTQTHAQHARTPEAP